MQNAKEKKDLEFQVKTLTKDNVDLKKQVQTLNKDLSTAIEVSEEEIESWKIKYNEILRQNEEERSELHTSLKSHVVRRHI